MEGRPDRTSGSRTAAYLVAAALGSIPLTVILGASFGFSCAVSAAILLSIWGVLWLMRQRQDDPGWDRRVPDGRRKPRR